MAKKRNLKYLLKNVPSPTPRNHGMITFLFAALIFFVFAYVFTVTYTGLVISESTEPMATMNTQNIVLDNQFEILDITKSENSVLNINVESDNSINIFAEIEDCSYWKNGKDINNNILYSVNNIKTGNFKIGDPSENTIQQIQLYQTGELCLIFINRKFPQTGNINIQYQEMNVDKWRIIQ